MTSLRAHQHDVATTRSPRANARQFGTVVDMSEIANRALDRKFRSRRGNVRSPDGNVLPRGRFTSDDVAKAQAQVLQRRYGRLARPAAEMASDTGQCERACRNHLQGVNCLSLTEFFNAAQEVEELRTWGAKMMGLEADLSPDFEPNLHRGLRDIERWCERNGVNRNELLKAVLGDQSRGFSSVPRPQDDGAHGNADGGRHEGAAVRDLFRGRH